MNNQTQTVDADLFGWRFQIVTSWDKAKPNDILARYDNGRVEILVARRIKAKYQANEIAEAVGGRVMLDGRRTWAVSRIEAGEAGR